MNPEVILTFFLGIMAGMFLVALGVFVYAMISSHHAYKANERELSEGLEALRREYRS